MKTPYIGICDFTKPLQVTRLLPLLPPNLPHKLMVGVMMSYKTLYDLPTKWRSVFVPKERIASIFLCEPRVMNTIHYADYDDKDQDFLSTLELVARYGGPFLNAIQLDMVWPDPRVLHAFRSKYPDIAIVLQVSEDAMIEVGDDPLSTRLRLELYGTAIDYVLLDCNMGEGKPMDAALLLAYAEEITRYLPRLGLAAAGGLGPYSLDLLDPLLCEYPHLSVDAQSMLRPSGSKVDPVHWGYARRYTKKVLSMIQEHPHWQAGHFPKICLGD